ncbi:hypothetical protein [Streptomyces sp. NPDC056641]|uniref:hypothetical protein n=1 Tax=unclassified Streptomyces TaxID=2593676 RepID=UPI00366077C5
MNDNVLKRRPCALVAVLLCAVGLLFAASPPAGADGGSGGGDLQVAQTLGDRELTVTLRRVTGVPGPLHVDVLTHTGTPAGRLRLAATPTGVSTNASAAATSGTATSTASVTLGATPGSYSAVLRVDGAGPWELSVDDGRRTARIPFVVPAQTASPPELTVYAGFVTAGVLILITLVVAVRARRGWWVTVPAGGAVAALATAVTGALLSASLPLPPEQGQQVDPTIDGVARPYSVVRPLTGDYSRPPASFVLRPVTAGAGDAADLRFSLYDGSTGLPADDLVVHDGALVHLLVIGPSGELRHLHPIRTGPGAFEVRLRLPMAGHYAVSAEFARRGGGVQQIRSATGFEAEKPPGPAPGGAVRATSPGATPAPEPPSGPGTTRTVGGVPVRLTAPSLTAGRPSVLTARFGDTATLQPWLGMVGHMIVVGPLSRADATRTTGLGEAAHGAEVWAHAHSMGGMSPESEHSEHAAHSGHDMAGMSGTRPDRTPGGSSDTRSMSGLMPLNGDSPADETVAAYGPDATFVHTFPAPGHYRVWIQAERDNTILTVPYLLQVASPSGGTP